MFLNQNKYYGLLIKRLAMLLAAIPIVITAYELLTSGKDSVVFLEGFPSVVVLPVLVFYALLSVWGIYWVIRQMTDFLKLRNEKAKTELLHLKSQVNPHFFFNMLNNLYGLVGSDTKKAQALLLKLSDMMRYSIYEGEKELVDLRQEVDYLNNFIALHQMRYHKKSEVVFEQQIRQEQQVSPLLFLILLENAFKHGIESLGEQAFVHVKLSADENEIRFEVTNNFDPAVQPPEGIGLKNLKRRLELMYPGKHRLVFSVREDVHNVQLTLLQK